VIKINILVLNPPSEKTKNIVRDLIYGCWCKGKRIGGMKSPPLGLLLVATILKENSHKVKLIDGYAEDYSFKKLVPIIKQTDAIILSTSTMSFHEDVDFLGRCKKIKQEVKTIIFGSHPTFMAKDCFEPPVDFIVQGEPEFIARDLIASLESGGGEYKKVKGIGFKENGRIQINEPYPLQELDLLPIPDRSLLPKDVDYFNPIVKKVPYTTMITSRGCPGLCTFCTVPNFYGNKTRMRSEELVLKELEEIKRQGYKEVWIRDETFTFYRDRNIRICKEMIRRKLNLSWLCNARVGTVDRKTMKLMKKAGCHMIKFGVESGDQQILNNVKKGITTKNTIKTYRWAHEVGMDTHAHMMLGMPGETRKTIEKSINFALKIDPTTVSFGICTPYAGTPLYYEVLKKNKEIRDGSALNLRDLHETSFYNKYFTSLTDKELEKYVKKAYRRFYLRPSYLFRFLLRIKDLDELRRVMLAGSNVFSFSLEKK
jgi:radical SAM superfamily enzyme YgiQ (UPF0313 family)